MTCLKRGLVRSLPAIVLFGWAGVAQAQAQAQSPAPLAETVLIELNKLEAVGGDCQATVVATNGPDKLDSLKLDLVIFDAQGVVSRRIAAEMGPLAAEKIVIKTFAVKDLACPSISRIVLNDLMACQSAAGPVSDCLDRLSLSSRAGAVFTK